AHFDTAAGIARTERVGGDVVDLRPLDEGKLRGGIHAFEHEGRFDDADVQLEMRDAEIGDTRDVDQRIAFAAGDAGSGAAVRATAIQAELIEEVAERLALDAEIGPAHERAGR